MIVEPFIDNLYINIAANGTNRLLTLQGQTQCNNLLLCRNGHFPEIMRKHGLLSCSNKRISVSIIEYLIIHGK